MSDFLWHMAPEVVEMYGDGSDWRNVVGTGAFMLTDFVPGSLMQYEKNPNFWMKDPILGNQLPYMDGIKVYVIADKSTQLAAFRTGKVDMLSGPTLLWEDVDQLVAENSDLMVKSLQRRLWRIWFWIMVECGIHHSLCVRAKMLCLSADAQPVIEGNIQCG